MKNYKKQKELKSTITKKNNHKEEELKKFIKELGIKTKEVPKNLSSVNEEFSLFLKKK